MVEADSSIFPYSTQKQQQLFDESIGVSDAGSLRLARELDAPGRLYRAGLVGIVEARRLLKEIADSAQNGLLVSRASDQPAFAATASSSFVFPRDDPVGPGARLPGCSVLERRER